MSEAAAITPPATGTPAAPPNAQPTPPPPAAAAPPPSDWTSGLNDDMKGYVQNKQFKDPSMVLDSYRSLESLLGAPKERLLKLPEKADDKAGWDDVYGKLGRPATAKDYKIPLEKGADEGFLNKAKEMYHGAGLTQAQAEKLTGQWNEYVAATTAEQQRVQSEKNVAEQTSLKKEWGAAFEQNTAVAKRAAQTFGIDAATVDKLESVLGFSGVIKLMHNIGSKLGEADFVVSEGTRGFGGALTPAAARNKIDTLKSDPDFVKRFSSGELAAKDEMTRLHRYAYPSEE